MQNRTQQEKPSTNDEDGFISFLTYVQKHKNEFFVALKRHCMQDDNCYVMPLDVKQGLEGHLIYTVQNQKYSLLANDEQVKELLRNLLLKVINQDVLPQNTANQSFPTVQNPILRHVSSPVLPTGSSHDIPRGASTSSLLSTTPDGFAKPIHRSTAKRLRAIPKNPSAGSLFRDLRLDSPTTPRVALTPTSPSGIKKRDSRTRPDGSTDTILPDVNCDELGTEYATSEEPFLGGFSIFKKGRTHICDNSPDSIEVLKSRLSSGSLKKLSLLELKRDFPAAYFELQQKYISTHTESSLTGHVLNSTLLVAQTCDFMDKHGNLTEYFKGEVKKYAAQLDGDFDVKSQTPPSDRLLPQK